MRDYIVRSNVIIKFKSTIYVKGTDRFDAEAKIEKLLRDILSNNKVLNVLVDTDTFIDVNINAKSFELIENE